MRSHRFWFVAAVAVGVLVADQHARTREASGAGGTGGTTNGLLPRVYELTDKELDRFMQMPLSTSPQELQIAYANLVTVAELVAGPGRAGQGQGELLLKYAIGCALPAGQPFPVGSEIGAGLMTPPVGVPKPWQHVWPLWPGDTRNAREDLSRREDIHTCMIARLNAFAVPVTIYLSGAHVTPPPPGFDPNNLFPFPEAAWLATVGPSHDVQFDVWPLDGLDGTFGSRIDLIERFLHLRVCGFATTSGETCGLKVHPHAELASSCKQEADGIWSCMPSSGGAHRPAIATRLTSCSWIKLSIWLSKIGICTPGSCAQPDTSAPGLSTCKDLTFN